MAMTTIGTHGRLAGELRRDGSDAGSATDTEKNAQTLDLLAVDAAYPAPVLPDTDRRLVHQAWHHGEVVLANLHDCPARPTALAPGSTLDANAVCEIVRRVARAVGAPLPQFSVRLSL